MSAVTFIIILASALIIILWIIPVCLVKSLKKRYSEKYKGEYVLLDSCMVINGAIRLPGIIMLLKDRIIYVIFKKERVIYLSNVNKVEQRSSLTYEWAYKKRIGLMRVLEIFHKDGVSRFYIHSKKIQEWVQHIGKGLEKKT